MVCYFHLPKLLARHLLYFSLWLCDLFDLFHKFIDASSQFLDFLVTCLEHLLQLLIAILGVPQLYLAFMHLPAHYGEFSRAIFFQILHLLRVSLLKLYLYLLVLLVPLLVVVLLHSLFILLRFEETDILGVELTLEILLLDGHALELAGDIEFIHCHFLHLRF